MIKIKKNWWKKTFSPIYFRSYQEDFSEENTEQQVDFIIKRLNLQKNDAILDLGCGIGRHSISLAKRGFKVTGVDYSSELLKIAKKAAKRASVKVNFIQTDIRILSLEKKYDVVLCLFTTLGYFSTNENKQTLMRMSEAIKQNGKILIDQYDYKKVLEKYKGLETGINDRKIVKSKFDYKRGTIFTHDEQSFDFKTNIEHTRRSFIFKKRKYFYDLYLTFYSLVQYKKYLDAVGLEIKQVWGEFDGTPRNNDTTRTIMLIKKKKSFKKGIPHQILKSLIERFKSLMFDYIN